MDIYAFIDSQNLNLSVQSAGWKLDFRKFIVFLREKYGVSKSFLFLGYVVGNEEMYAFLQRIGYVLIFKPTLRCAGGKIKGNCDAELVLHCMIEKDNFAKAIIVAGDGDYHCLIEYLEDQNKLFLVGIPNSNYYSALLRKFSKYFFYIDKLRGKLAYE
ncbi:MAG: NYN domain-containing protein [Candidatus Gracilibacteria bacterium]